MQSNRLVPEPLPSQYCTLKRIRNIYSQNPNSATSLPNTKFIFPKQIFIILCGPSLPMRPKARVLALMSVKPKLISAVYQQLDCQMHTAEQLLTSQAAWVVLPSVHHGQNHSYWATPTPIKVNTLAFCLICLSPLPPLKTGVLYTATSAAHRTHDRFIQYF